MKSRGESLFLLFLIAFFGFWTHQSLQLTSRRATQYDVGVNFFPFVLSVGMLILTAIVLAQKLWLERRSARIEGAADEEALSPRQLMMSVALFLAVLAVLLVYTVLMRPLGFGAATLIFLLIMNSMIAKLTTGSLPSLKQFLGRLVGFGVFAFGMPFVFRYVFRLILP